MRAESTRAGGRWVLAERMEAEPEAIPAILEPDLPVVPAKCPLWVAAHMDKNTLQVLAGMFHATVYDFETRYITVRSVRVGHRARF